MSTINSRFGEIEYVEEAPLTFPEGLIGFEQLRQFVVMPNEKHQYRNKSADKQFVMICGVPKEFE